MLKLYNIQGIITINPNKIGNNTVQQKAINWSKRILGKEALVHIKIKIRIELFKPKFNPYNNPSIRELLKKSKKRKEYISYKTTEGSISIYSK